MLIGEGLKVNSSLLSLNLVSGSGCFFFVPVAVWAEMQLRFDSKCFCCRPFTRERHRTETGLETKGLRRLEKC